MKSTILSEKDLKLIEKAIALHGRILNSTQLSTIFAEDYSVAGAHNRINHLVGAGWLRRIKQGLYVIIDSLTARFQNDISLLRIANALEADSYVSLSHALNHYQLFDQLISTVVSITTHRSKKYLFDEYTFKFSHVNNPVYFGFTEVLENGRKVKIAEAEKALIDYLYLDTSFSSASLVFEKLRDYHQELNLSTLQEYAIRTGITVTKKVGFMLDSLRLDSHLVYEAVKDKAGASRFTVDSKTFNATWRLYYDPRIIG